MPIRTCVACRSRRPDDQLVRLCLGEGARATVDGQRALGGRGAWVCPRRACVEQVEHKPAQLSRRLRAGGAVDAEGLLDAVRASEQRLALDALRAARRAGLVVSGTLAVAVAPALAALVVATDAGASALRVAASAHLLDAEAVGPVGLDRVALGRTVDRGPRALVGVAPGRPARRVAARLRRLRDLG